MEELIEAVVYRRIVSATCHVDVVFGKYFSASQITAARITLFIFIILTNNKDSLIEHFGLSEKNN